MVARAPVAIIDIGSNSVRLVVYSGATRIPSVIFNEKIMAGLGRGADAGGPLAEEAQARALGALARFALLTRQMGVARSRVVATAAVRDAPNRDLFLGRIRKIGFKPELLSGEEEGRMAGLGVISGIPDADGIVGDLGGGSLELVDLRGGEVRRGVSLPLGVLRLGAFEARGEAAFAKKIAKAVEGAGFARAARGRNFYMVGGSWRALAQLDLALIEHPLPITHQHDLDPGRPAQLRALLKQLDREVLRGIVSASRVSQLPRATQLLEALVPVLEPAALMVSSFGIREGLLYDGLASEIRRLDPLIEATREAGAGLGRFQQHGALLDRWIAPVFDDRPQAARLRLAACHLSDIAWAAHPDFRAERGIDMALHGNWVAIDAPGRVMLAQALFCAFGGGRDLPYPAIAGLCSAAELERAMQWGFAMRLGQRLSGGVAAGLERSRLVREDGVIRLEIRRSDSALYTEIVERRFKSLAAAIDCRTELKIVA